MPRPLGSKNRPGSRKPGPKPGSKNKATSGQKRQAMVESLMPGSPKCARIEPIINSDIGPAAVGLATAVMPPLITAGDSNNVDSNSGKGIDDGEVDVCGGGTIAPVQPRTEGQNIADAIAGMTGCSMAGQVAPPFHSTPPEPLTLPAFTAPIPPIPIPTPVPSTAASTGTCSITTGSDVRGHPNHGGTEPPRAEASGVAPAVAAVQLQTEEVTGGQPCSTLSTTTAIKPLGERFGDVGAVVNAREVPLTVPFGAGSAGSAAVGSVPVGSMPVSGVGPSRPEGEQQRLVGGANHGDPYEVIGPRQQVLGARVAVGPRQQAVASGTSVVVGAGGRRMESIVVESPGQRGGGDRPVRLSPAMHQHVTLIKHKIDANVRHKGGKATPTKSGGGYPFDGPLVMPGCPTMGHAAGLPDVSRFYLKAVFAWIPEYLWPDQVEFVPCPNCGSAGKPDGWTPQQPRRCFMEHGVAYIIGFRYKCPKCAEHNKNTTQQERRTTSYHAWDPACLERLPDNVSREYPFIPTRKSAVHVRLIDRLAHDLIDGKGFSATATYIRQTYVNAFTVDKAKYDSLVEARRRTARVEGGGGVGGGVGGGGGGGGGGGVSSTVGNVQAPSPSETPEDGFGLFDDALKYSGATPTEPYLRHVWRIWFPDLSVKSPNISWSREDYQYRVMRLWDAPAPPQVLPSSSPKLAYGNRREQVTTNTNTAPLPPPTPPLPPPLPSAQATTAEKILCTATTGS